MHIGGGAFLRVKLPECEAGHSPAYSAEVKTGCSYIFLTSPPPSTPFAFMACTETPLPLSLLLYNNLQWPTECFETWYYPFTIGNVETSLCLKADLFRSL